MVLRATLTLLAVALLAPVLYERAQILYLFWRNAPVRFTRIDNLGSHDIKFADRIRSCEDALLVESQGLAILGCDPGRERWNTVMGVFLPGPVPSAELYAYDYKKTNAPESESLRRLEFVDFEYEADFHTLGMAYDEASSTLFATSHRQDKPTIEMFKLDLTAYTATHLRSIQHDLLHGPNAIAVINSHEFYVTNNNHFLVKNHPTLNHLETYLGVPGGTVVHIDVSPALKSPAGPVQANVVARVPFANGIDILNETTVVVASSSRAAVYFFSIGPKSDSLSSTPTPVLTYSSQLRVPFLADNLSVTKDGTLMIAGHPHMPTLGKFAQTRNVCNGPEDELTRAAPEMREYCAKSSAPSWVSEWTEAGGLKHLYADVRYPSSCTAVRDSERNVGIITGLYAKGILVY
ncbi:Uu.00g026200.m01.CDS01 [Anthostomella pinea]|uniref:Uu.00g026200.m01.CDS01 n=1 Tax=Anthostomella pinea TaxID=933095 RepID=A0AAI8V821_9PEZI|nr:Uu.00g026200.m01.CDS01 [Anthostomella pinea]